jgi:beta-glucosidase
MGGCWTAAHEPENHISVIGGLQRSLPGTELVRAAGVGIDDDDGSGIAAAAELGATADAILLCLGESAAMSGEAASRACPDLPGKQRALAEAVLERARAQGVRVIVLLFSGRPLVVPWLAAQADALLAVWFLGSEAGNAIADVLTGRSSPGGRTPISWPRAIGQVPVFFGQRPSGRPAAAEDRFTSKYLDVANEPLYPFGHGLTYGRFTLANFRVTPASVAETATIEARLEVTNEGRHAAEETVFLFTHDKLASVTRPLLELRAFGKIRLQPGETGTLSLSVAAAALRFPGLDLTPVFEAGEIEVLAGPCADRAQLMSATIRLRV